MKQIKSPCRQLTFAATTCLVSVMVSSCASTEASQSFSAPKRGDAGVVIAKSYTVPGVTNATAVAGASDDCSGPGLGVKVESTLSDTRYLFDKNGEPCEAAQTLFDGRNALDRRPSDPSINLVVHDERGSNSLAKSLEDQLPSLTPIPDPRLKSEMLPVADLEPAAGPSNLGSKAASSALAASAPTAGPDPLLATLAVWENQDRIYAQRATETAAAAERDLSNISNDRVAATEEERVATLLASLREQERQAQEAQRRHQETLARAQQNRQVTVAAREQWLQKEQELETNLKATQQRLNQFEQLSQRLAAEKSEKEKTYQQKIASLSSDLKAAEAQADISRRELVLKAAAKIAEAEQLARAAKLQEQDSKLREAARLKGEAETVMDHALAIRAGNNVVVGGLGIAPPVPLNLLETPVTVRANGQTLPDIIASILNQAASQAGQWQADWQLTATAQPMLTEKWSLTAEAPIREVLAQLKQQVKASYGIDLVFTQFGQNRLLVVTDATPPLADATKK